MIKQRRMVDLMVALKDNLDNETDLCMDMSGRGSGCLYLVTRVHC